MGTFPLRVLANSQPHVARRGHYLQPHHPMGNNLCPVCGNKLGGQKIAYIYLGTAPDKREGPLWNGQGIAVHDVCAPEQP